MSRDPGESPDEDGEPVDQPAERSPDPDPEPSDSTDSDTEPTIHRLDDEQDEPADEADTGGAGSGSEPAGAEDDEENASADTDPAESDEDDETANEEEDGKAADTGEDAEAEEVGEGEKRTEDDDDKEVEDEDGEDGEDKEDGADGDVEGEDDGDQEEEGETDEDVEGDAEGEEEPADDEDEEAEEEAVEEDEGDEESEESEEDETDSETTSTPIQRKAGPPEDQEQPLTEHIEEMVKRVAIVLFVAGIVSLIAFPYGEEFINFLWYSVLPSDISKPHVYHPLELIVTQLKAASLLGVVLALPVFVYQTYAFMRPGLYPNERRYYLAAVPTSLVLAFVGLLFGYFLILPAVMSYFMQYSRDVVDIAFALGDTFSLMLVLLGFLAVVFQIPLFIMLAIMMGLTTRTWLEDKRLIMWGVFLGIAFLFSPDPTGMAPFLVALTMVGLYEGTLLLLRWTGRGNR